MSYHYGLPPSHHTRFYAASDNSSDGYTQYAAQHDATPLTYSRKTTYASSGVGGFFPPADGDPPYDDLNLYHTKPHNIDYVYVGKGKTDYYPGFEQTSSLNPFTGKQTAPVYFYDNGAEHAMSFNEYQNRAAETKAKHKEKPSTDNYFYASRDCIYTERMPKRPSTRQASTDKTSPRKPLNTHSNTSAKATKEDRDRAGIPAGYFIKNWDASEEHIILLGSVFDANSLGRWIYDWTAYHHGASAPMADMAGDLWLLLIKLAGKLKRAEGTLMKIRNVDSREMVDDFVRSGHRLSNKFETLLEQTEKFMLRVPKTDGSDTIGKNVGTEFVESIFGRDRYLERTQSIMVSIRLWCVRFDANCEGILRHPSAA